MASSQFHFCFTDIERYQFLGQCRTAADKGMQQAHLIVFPVIRIVLIVGDKAEQMVVYLAQDKRLRIVLIIYIGEDDFAYLYRPAAG